MANHPDIDIAWVTLNRACNLRCRWCYATGTGYGAGDDIPFELFRKILDLVCELGVRKVTLTGGEPTIYPRVLEAVRYCKARGLDVTMPTNGLAFASRDCLDQFFRAGVDRIGMSVKGHDRESHINVTGVDCYDNVVKAIGNLAHQKDIEFVVLTVVTPENKHHIADVLRMAKDAGASAFALLPYRDFGCLDGGGELYCRPGGRPYVVELADFFESHFVELKNITEGLIQLEHTLPLCLWDPAFTDMLDERHWLSGPCQLHRHDGLIFDTEGYVIPCNAMPDIRLGRLYEDFWDCESFWEFWSSPEVADRFSIMSSAPDGRCDSCGMFERCRGGCVSNWLNFSLSSVRTPHIS